MLSVIDINPKAGKALLMSLKNGAAANMLLRTFTVRKLYLSILQSNGQKLDFCQNNPLLADEFVRWKVEIENEINPNLEMTRLHELYICHVRVVKPTTFSLWCSRSSGSTEETASATQEVAFATGHITISNIK